VFLPCFGFSGKFLSEFFVCCIDRLVVVDTIGAEVKQTTQTRNTTMNQNETRERMLKELMSDLANMVEAGEITDMEANEWYSMKADQWANGI
jgi:hypothetical protein